MKKIIFTYLVVFLLFSFFFLSLFHLPIQDFQPVLFYRGLVYLSITTLLFLFICIILVFKKQLKIHTESIVAAILVSASIHLSLFVILPVTFDRSVTTYLLNTIKQGSNNQQCQGLPKNDLEQKLVKEYILEGRALEKRINEQKVIDFMEEQDGCIKVTQKANNFLYFSEYIKDIYSIK